VHHELEKVSGFGCFPSKGSESAWREGESPTIELVGLEGGEGQESIGSLWVVKHTDGVRILSRSKTLKLRAHGLSEVVLGRLSMNPVIVQLDAVQHASLVLSDRSLRAPMWFATEAS
jgi:hypothetical protein